MKWVLFSFIIFLSASCSSSVDGQSANTNGEWLIAKDEVRDGGPGKDGIPAISDPNMIPIRQADFLDNWDIVVGYRSGDQVRFYPHAILDWHEIVNDKVRGQAVSVSYCPLTGSSVGLLGQVVTGGQPQETTFGVSGLLYNSNLILYDRLTDSHWSQMLNQCVNGPLIGDFPDNVTLVEMSFLTAKTIYPDAMILSDITGIYPASRYQQYPYGNYKSEPFLLFPVNNEDSRFNRKKRVFGVAINGAAQAYTYESFDRGPVLVEDVVGDEPILLIGDRREGYMAAYKRHFKNGEERNFSVLADRDEERVFEDGQGNFYDVFGVVVSGPDAGQRLEPVHGYAAFWFAWAAFYPQTGVYE